MKEEKNKENYDDIINMPHHISTKHSAMPLADRAAQFSPFAALNGHSEAIEETARLTDNESVLDEDKINRLNEKLQIIQNSTGTNESVTFTYFVPDEKKSGGKYISHTGKIKKIDEYSHRVIMADGTIIPVRHICEIESNLFQKMELFD